MHSYMLLLHEVPGTYAKTSPAEMQDIVARYRAWAGDLAQRGLLVGGDKLHDDGGRHLRLVAGQTLASDGPYAEAQDVVGGTFVVKAAGDADAEALAASCPHLNGRNWIEVRRIDPMTA
jgi:hypothetical protein